MDLVSNFDFLYDPYPIGIAKNVFGAETYKELVRTFPKIELFEYMEKLGHKYSLSERNNPENYHAFIQGNKAWKECHDYIKSDEFVIKILEELKEKNLDVGYLDVYKNYGTDAPAYKKLARNVLEKGIKTISKNRVDLKNKKFYTRFEFSALPADGGYILPHTDAPNKIITLIFSMFDEGEWNDQWGGSTEVLRPKDIKKNFNFLNKQMPFEEMERVSAFEFNPNQAIVFIKTFNSHHAVWPMTGPKDVFRKTLTVNLEIT